MDRLTNLPVLRHSIVELALVHLITSIIYIVVARLTGSDRARALKGTSPGMLPLQVVPEATR